MKKFLALVMAAVLLCSTFSFTFAETTSCDNGHDFTGNEKVTKVEPTCTEKGLSTQKCNRCGKDIEDDIPAKGHTSKALPLEIKGENCGDEIIEVYAKCDVCGAENFTKSKGFIQHEYDKENATNYKVVEPTCTEAGYTEYYCIRNGCGHPERVVGAPALGHDWKIANTTDEGYGPIDPTCYASGQSGQYIYCDRCKLHASTDFIDANNNGVKDEGELSVDAHVVPALSHSVLTEFGADFDDLFFIDDADGFVYVTDYVLTLPAGVTVLDKNDEYVWPLSHSGKVTITYTPETCTTDGSITVECSCGNYKRTETLKKWGHDYNMMMVSYVDNEGNTQRIEMPLSSVAEILADKYGIIIDEVAEFLDLNISTEKLMQIIYTFDYTLATEHKMADCTIKPIVQYICDNCGDRVDAQGYACTEHTFGEDWSDWKLWESDYGMAYTDGEMKPVKLPIDLSKLIPTVVEVRQLQVPEYDADQDWEIYERQDQKEVIAKSFEVMDKIAWCTDMEVTVRCAHCAITKTFKVEGLGHINTERAIIRTATCTSAGLIIKACADENCGWTVAESYGPVAHTWDLTKTKVVAPSCTENGTRTFVCGVCGFEKEEDVPSYGHDYEWEVTKEAGCKVVGEKKLICQRCDDVKETASIPEAHVFASINDITAMTNVTKEAIDDIRVHAYDKDGKLIGWMLPEVPWTDCTKDGVLQFVCINCKNVKITHTACEHRLEETGDVLETKWTLVDEETCRQTSVVEYDCLDCPQTVKKTETFDHEHKWDENTDNVFVPTQTKPTCQKDGLAYYGCARCGEHYLDTVKAFNHSYKTVYSTEKNCWTYVCEWCGEVEEAVYAAEKYIIDTSKIVWANKTSGTGYAELEESLNPTFVLGARYAFIQWTWVTKNGDNVVADNVVELKYLEDGKYSFNAKGVSVAGATLDNVVIYITDDADAVDFSSTNYGATRMD